MLRDLLCFGLIYLLLIGLFPFWVALSITVASGSCPPSLDALLEDAASAYAFFGNLSLYSCSALAVMGDKAVDYVLRNTFIAVMLAADVLEPGLLFASYWVRDHAVPTLTDPKTTSAIGLLVGLYGLLFHADTLYLISAEGCRAAGEGVRELWRTLQVITVTLWETATQASVNPLLICLLVWWVYVKTLKALAEEDFASSAASARGPRGPAGPAGLTQG